MSSEAPPTYNVGIFIPSYWVASTTGFDKAYADTHYLKFPVAQGTEYMTDLVVSGTTTLGATSASSLSVTNKTTTANIDLVNSSSTLDMKSGSITNLTNINGSAYPQAAGLNAVLATGNTTTNKDILMYGSASITSNNLQLSGDQAYFSASSSFYTSKLQKDTLTMINNTIQSILASGGLIFYNNSTAPTINNTYITSSDFTITGSTTSITNTLTSISNTIADATNTSAQTSSLLSMYLTGSTPNSVSSSNLTNTALSIYNSASTGLYSFIDSTSFSINGGSSLINTLTATQSVIRGSSSTTNKSTNSASGIAVVGSNINTTNTLTSGSLVVNNTTYKNTIQANGITQILNADATINNSVLNNSSLTLTGSTTSTTNTINSTSNAIADATYTGTLSSNALNLFTNSVSTARNAITNAGMTITGSTTSITHTLTSTSNAISNGTASLTSAILSSIPTLTALTATGGNSSVITPTTIGVYNVDGTTTANRTEITRTGLTTYIADSNNGANVNSTSGFTILSGGLGARVQATQIYIAGSGSLGPAMNRDASTTTSSFEAAINAGFTPDTTVGASINLKNSNTGAGLVGGNPIIYERTKATTAVGDIIGSHHYFMKDAGGTRKEYARTTAVVKDQTTGSISGSLDFQVAVGGTLTNAFQVNGVENQINAFQPLDMNNNAIVSSTGGITLNASGSSGTGVITLNTKNGTAGTGTGLVLTGNTLTLSTTGPNTQANAHLCLYLPDPNNSGVSTLFKIQLLT